MPIIVSVSGHSLPWGQEDIVPYFICTYDFCLHRDEDKGDDVDVVAHQIWQKDKQTQG